MLNASSPLNRDRFVKSPREILRATQKHTHTHGTVQGTQWEISEYTHHTHIYMNVIMFFSFLSFYLHSMIFHSIQIQSAGCIIVLFCAFVFKSRKKQ